MKEFIKETLHKLGITRTYLGYYAVIQAVMLVLEDEYRLLNVTKELYKPIAELNGCKISCVERNIRTVIFIAWSTNRELMNEMAGYALEAPPMVSQFIDIISRYVQRSYGVLRK